MTVTADRAAARRSGTRVSGPGPARAAEQLSHADRAARGKDARAAAPLESHAEFRPGRSRDPVGLLPGQAASRVPELVPVRHGRMLVSAFTFYPGGQNNAVVMTVLFLIFAVVLIGKGIAGI